MMNRVYRRFGDKERLLSSVEQSFAHHMRDELICRCDTSVLPPEPIARDVVSLAVGALVDASCVNERLLRVFYTIGLHNTMVARDGSLASIESKRVFEAAFDDVAIECADRGFALDFAYRLVYGALYQRVMHGELHISDRPLSWEQLRTELIETVSRYLLAPPAVATV